MPASDLLYTEYFLYTLRTSYTLSTCCYTKYLLYTPCILYTKYLLYPEYVLYTKYLLCMEYLLYTEYVLYMVLAVPGAHCTEYSALSTTGSAEASMRKAPGTEKGSMGAARKTEGMHADMGKGEEGAALGKGLFGL